MTQAIESPGQKLDRYLRRAKMQQKELAAHLGVEPSYVSRMVNDRVGWVYGRYFGQIASLLRLKDDEIKELNPAAVIEMAPTTYGNSAPAGLRHRDEVVPVHDLHRIPVRGMAAAGPAFFGDDNILGYEYVEDENYRLGMLSVEIDGDSMEPTIPNGSRVYIDSRELEPQDGKMYLIHIVGDGLVVKRAKRVSGSWFLMSDNPKYQAFTPDEATIIGEVYYIQPRGWKP